MVADEWRAKGATLSDKSARAELGLSQQEILAAVEAGRLQYRVGSVHGNPWLRLLRREVEQLAQELHGSAAVEEQKLRSELSGIRRELKRLRGEVDSLQQRESELVARLGRHVAP